MDNNESNIKSQQTGGLKLMTVFIAVLALHVVVIGGFTVYHLMSGGSTDADLGTLDKTHKGLKGADSSAVADGATPDATQSEKNAATTTTPTPPTEVASIPANPPTPAPDLTAPSELVTPAPGPAPVLKSISAPPTPTLTPKPATPAPSTEVTDKMTPTSPVSSDLTLAPAPIIPAPTPSTPVASGPVHMPPAVASAPAGQHIYVVKITDSYKKIAQAHHITVAQLKEVNHIKGDVLHTGQKLVIPSARTLVATTTPTTALDSTPTGPILSESALASTAILASAPSNETAAGLHRHLYTVVKGDTLIKIAHRFKTTATAIMAENSITDPAKLTIGKKLKIPSQESRSARNGVPSSTQPSQAQTRSDAPSAQLANFVP
jgi:LysM repeat protein